VRGLGPRRHMTEVMSRTTGDQFQDPQSPDCSRTLRPAQPAATGSRAHYPPLMAVPEPTVVLVVRPRTYEEPRLTTAVRLPTRLHLRLRAAARQRQVSANLLVEWAITDFLDRLPPPVQSALGAPE
jgi:hypothetical protein